jgi:hypothetical protein
MTPATDQTFLGPAHQCLCLFAYKPGNSNQNDGLYFRASFRQSYCRNRSRLRRTLSGLVTYP